MWTSYEKLVLIASLLPLVGIILGIAGGTFCAWLDGDI